MGRYLDIADEWERKRKQEPGPGCVDGHAVSEIIMQTDKMVVFRDSEGQTWRRVHSWGMTWPVEIRGRE